MTAAAQGDYATEYEALVKPPRTPAGYIRSSLRSIVLSMLGGLQFARRERFVRCLYCHYVFDDQVEQFRKILTSFQELGTFVDTDTCVSMIEGKTPIDGRYFHLAFDDGFRNVFRNAVPVLRELSIPAVFFVPTSLVNADWETTRHYCFEVLNRRNVIEFATWDDLSRMKEWGFEIGSHTRTHARFSAVNDLEMTNEIWGSKQDLEEKLGTPCKYISWPYGRWSDVGTVALERIKEAGYKACFGGFRSRIDAGITDLFAIPRHHFEVQWPLNHIRFFMNGNVEMLPTARPHKSALERES